jgi:hypothetical protein
LEGVTRQELVELLNSTGSWIYMSRPFAKVDYRRIGHFVVVDGMDDTGKFLRIRDPRQGTRYMVTMEDFLYWWFNDAVWKYP